MYDDYTYLQLKNHLKIMYRTAVIVLFLSIFFHPLFLIKAQDESERNLLTSDRVKLENLLAKADVFEKDQSDSCVIYGNEAARLALAYGAPRYHVLALDVLGKYYYHKQNYPEAVKNYTGILQNISLLVDSLQKADFYFRLGMTYSKLSVYDESANMLFRSAKLANQYQDTVLLAKCYLNIGMMYLEMNHAEEAADYLQKSIDLYKIQNREDEANIFLNMGKISYRTGNIPEATGFYLSAIKMYGNENNMDGIADGNLELAILYENTNDINKSEMYYNQALDLYLQTGNRSGTAHCYYGLGSVKAMTNDLDASLKYYIQSLNVYKNQSSVKMEADCHRELASIYGRLDDNRSAYAELIQFVNLSDSIFNERSIEKVAAMGVRYKVYLMEQDIALLQQERQKVIRDINRRNISLIGIISLTIIIIVVTVYYTRTLRRANNKLHLEIAEKLKAEHELLQVKENLEWRVAERTRELEIAKLKAEESDRLKSAFLANMSHEIRTPLNAITGYAGLLLKEDLSKIKRKEYNDLIIKNNRLLLSMIEDLIDTSKIESGSLQLFIHEVSVANILDQLEIPLSENLIDHNKLNLKIEKMGPEIHTETIFTDPVRVQQVLCHLLDNAVKYTPHGIIRYGCKEMSDDIVFFIEDTGIGIPEEYKEIIFEKFRQLDGSSRRTSGGTGLGLYYAQKIAAVLGGKIWFESRKEEGTVFYFSLPLNKHNMDQ